MLKIEEIDERDIRVRFQVDLQVAHEPAGGQPEIVADQDERLDVLAVAMPQRGNQIRVGLAPPGEQPLLELVEDQQHLLTRAQHPPPPQRCQSIDQARRRASRDRACAGPGAAGPRSLRGWLRCRRAARSSLAGGATPP